MTQLHSVQFLITDSRELVLITTTGARVIPAEHCVHVIAALRHICGTNIPQAPKPTAFGRRRKNHVWTNVDYYDAMAKMPEEFTSKHLGTILLGRDLEYEETSPFSSFLNRAFKREHVQRNTTTTPFIYRLTPAGLEYITSNSYRSEG